MGLFDDIGDGIKDFGNDTFCAEVNVDADLK